MSISLLSTLFRAPTPASNVSNPVSSLDFSRQSASSASAGLGNLFGTQGGAGLNLINGLLGGISGSTTPGSFLSNASGVFGSLLGEGAASTPGGLLSNTSGFVSSLLNGTGGTSGLLNLVSGAVSGLIGAFVPGPTVSTSTPSTTPSTNNLLGSWVNNSVISPLLWRR